MLKENLIKLRECEQEKYETLYALYLEQENKMKELRKDIVDSLSKISDVNKTLMEENTKIFLSHWYVEDEHGKSEAVRMEKEKDAIIYSELKNAMNKED